MAKNPPNRRGTDPKSVQKCALFGTRFEASRAKKGKIRYVLNGISEILAYPNFDGQKNRDFFARQEVAKSLSERAALSPRNPYKTSTKALEG